MGWYSPPPLSLQVIPFVNKVGNFTNISPAPWLGAFHWSDLLMIFGTYSKDVGEIPQLEVDTSAAMQDYILAFLKDSESVKEMGWPVFDPTSGNNGTVLEFGKGVPVRNITGEYIDGVCHNSSAPVRLSG